MRTSRDEISKADAARLAREWDARARDRAVKGDAHLARAYRREADTWKRIAEARKDA